MKFKVLMIEDDRRYVEELGALLTASGYEFFSATRSVDAALMLRMRRFDVVLLDLSMQEGMATDRSNTGIQDHLSLQPDGCLYIVVSANAKRQETSDLAFDKNAAYVYHKGSGDVDGLEERIHKVLQKRPQSRILEENEKSVGALLGDDLQQARLISTTGSKGFGPLRNCVVSLVQMASPLKPLLNQPLQFQIAGDGASVIGWSREFGFAVGLLVTSSTIDDTSAIVLMKRALNLSAADVEIIERTQHGKVLGRMFRLDSLGHLEFDLPLITVPAP